MPDVSKERLSKLLVTRRAKDRREILFAITTAHPKSGPEIEGSERRSKSERIKRRRVVRSV